MNAVTTASCDDEVPPTDPPREHPSQSAAFWAAAAAAADPCGGGWNGRARSVLAPSGSKCGICSDGDGGVGDGEHESPAHRHDCDEAVGRWTRGAEPGSAAALVPTQGLAGSTGLVERVMAGIKSQSSHFCPFSSYTSHSLSFVHAQDKSRHSSETARACMSCVLTQALQARSRPALSASPP